MVRAPKKRSDPQYRYRLAITAFRSRSKFQDDELHEMCEETSRTFLRKLLKMLIDDGILFVHESNSGKEYSWIADREGWDETPWITEKLCGTQLTQTPRSERPRERLLQHGPEKLRTAELLAILIRSGRPGESALQAGEKIANRVKEKPEILRRLSPLEFKSISHAVSEACYCQIMAGIELGRRVFESLSAQEEKRPIRSSSDAVEYCRRHFSRLALDRLQEEFHIVTLDTKLHPIQHHQITVGTLDASLVAPREVFRPAIRDAAAAVLLVHNHPSGDPTPSRQDFQVTQRLDEAAKIIGIQVIDHIVVGSTSAVSVRDLQP